MWNSNSFKREREKDKNGYPLVTGEAKNWRKGGLPQKQRNYILQNSKSRGHRTFVHLTKMAWWVKYIVLKGKNNKEVVGGRGRSGSTYRTTQFSLSHAFCSFISNPSTHITPFCVHSQVTYLSHEQGTLWRGETIPFMDLARHTQKKVYWPEFAFLDGNWADWKMMKKEFPWVVNIMHRMLLSQKTLLKGKKWRF